MTKFDAGINRIDEIMHELGIKYAFISGTALGLRREGRCLDYDADIDFCIHVKDRNKIDAIKQKLEFDILSEMKFGNRICVVGFGYGNNKENWVEMDMLHTRGDTVWHSWQDGEKWVTNVYPKRMWDTLQYIEAYGVRCPVFSPIDEYLELTYGADWRTERRDFSVVEKDRKTITRRYDFDIAED